MTGSNNEVVRHTRDGQQLKGSVAFAHEDVLSLGGVRPPDFLFDWQKKAALAATKTTTSDGLPPRVDTQGIPLAPCVSQAAKTRKEKVAQEKVSGGNVSLSCFTFITNFIIRYTDHKGG